MYDWYQMKNKKFREQIHECLGVFMSVQEESVILNMIELFKFGLSLYSTQTENREYAIVI